METLRKKTSAQRSDFEFKRNRLIAQDVRWIMDHVLNRTDSLMPIPPPQPAGRLRRGFHCHNTWEVFCPLQGELTFQYLGEPAQTCAEGMLLLIPPDKPHRAIKNLNPSPSLRFLSFTCLRVEKTFWILDIQEAQHRRRAILHPDLLPSWIEQIGMQPEGLLDRAAQSVTMGEWGRESALGLLRHLFSTFMLATDEMAAGSRNLSRAERLVTRAVLQLQTRYYSSTLKLQSVAADVGVSLSHLHRLFQDGTGKTLHQMLTEIRMRRAEELLKNTSYSIKEVAYLTGWKNQLYFSAAFHKHNGESPTAFRKRHSPTSP